MNIFILDSHPVKAAQYYCDTHSSKMVLELAQMLCTTLHSQGIDAPYKPTHMNHPSTKWVRHSLENFNWALEHAFALCAEKTKRFGKPHKSEEVIRFVSDNSHKLNFDNFDLTQFAIAIADDCECRKNPKFNVDNPVEAYRLYYIHDKKHIAKWKYTETPEWFKNYE